MSIYNLVTMSNDTLKKLVKELIALDNVYDECGRPVLLHKEEECTRDVYEGLEVIVKNWRDLRRQLKPILREIQEERGGWSPSRLTRK